MMEQKNNSKVPWPAMQQSNVWTFQRKYHIKRCNTFMVSNTGLLDYVLDIFYEDWIIEIWNVLPLQAFRKYIVCIPILFYVNVKAGTSKHDTPCINSKYIGFILHLV